MIVIKQRVNIVILFVYNIRQICIVKEQMVILQLQKHKTMFHQEEDMHKQLKI